MLQPSDIAPKGVLFNPISKDSETLTFNTNNVSFNSDGPLSVTLLGTKNDSSRAGFQVHVQPASSKKFTVRGLTRGRMLISEFCTA